MPLPDQWLPLEQEAIRLRPQPHMEIRADRGMLEAKQRNAGVEREPTVPEELCAVVAEKRRSAVGAGDRQAALRSDADARGTDRRQRQHTQLDLRHLQ